MRESPYPKTGIHAPRTEPVYMKVWTMEGCSKAFFPIPKNASSSLREQMTLGGRRKGYQITKLELYHRLDEFEDVVALVRHPYDRLSSCYAHFESRPKFFKERGVTSYRDFLELVIVEDDDVTNMHWRSQAGIMSLWGTLLATKLYRFPDVKSVMDEFDIPVIGTRNTTSHPHDGSDIPEDLKPLIDKRYSKDFELWERAVTNV